MGKKFWNLKNESETAEILIYGQISDESWFEDDVTPNQFASDLKSLEGKDVTVRINSYGGDVFAAQAIYNQLKSYSGKVNVKIDGICASAATIISCAGDTVSMPNNSIFMIHNPATLLIGAYDAPYLEKVNKALTTIKQTIINVYLSKTDQLNAKKLSKMMDEETHMDAETAKNYGFVDEICTNSAKIENKNGQIYINSLAIDTKNLRNLNEFEKIINRKVSKVDDKTLFQKFKNWLHARNEDAEEDEKTQKDDSNDNDSGGTDNKITDKAVENAIAAERQRMTALDAMKTGNAIIDKYIDTAKANGESVEKVKDYVNTMKEAMTTQDKGQQALNAMVNDNLSSGAENLKGDLPEDDNNEAAKEAAINSIAKYINESRGVK